MPDRPWRRRADLRNTVAFGTWIRDYREVRFRAVLKDPFAVQIPPSPLAPYDSASHAESTTDRLG